MLVRAAFRLRYMLYARRMAKMTTKLATAMPTRAAVLNRSLQMIRPKLMGEVSCEGAGGKVG